VEAGLNIAAQEIARKAIVMMEASTRLMGDAAETLTMIFAHPNSVSAVQNRASKFSLPKHHLMIT
jgi:hypothetical protein